MQVLSGYVDTSVTTDCSNNYTAYFTNTTLYSSTTPFSLDSSSGILKITSNIEFSYSLYIIVSTTDLTLPITSSTSSFTVK